MMKARKWTACCVGVVLVLGLFCGCSREPDDQVDYETRGKVDLRDMHMVEEDCVADADTAVAVGKAVVAGRQKDGLFPDYVLKECTYYEDDLCWVLRFAPKETLPGSELYVKITQSNGQIEIWVN